LLSSFSRLAVLKFLPRLSSTFPCVFLYNMVRFTFKFCVVLVGRRADTSKIVLTTVVFVPINSFKRGLTFFLELIQSRNFLQVLLIVEDFE
jgi:hypothetical protein